MAKPSTRRLAIDFETMRKAAHDSWDRTPEIRSLWLQGKLKNDPDPGWDDDWVNSLAEATEGRRYDSLLAMLEAKMPISLEILPGIAAVIRQLREGGLVGEAAKITTTGDRRTLSGFSKLRPIVESDDDAYERLAEIFGVSADTVKRSLRRALGRRGMTLQTLKRDLGIAAGRRVRRR